MLASNIVCLIDVPMLHIVSLHSMADLDHNLQLNAAEFSIAGCLSESSCLQGAKIAHQSFLGLPDQVMTLWLSVSDSVRLKELHSRQTFGLRAFPPHWLPHKAFEARGKLQVGLASCITMSHSMLLFTHASVDSKA